MSRFNLPEILVADDAQQRNNEAIATAVNAVSQFFFYGAGAPTFTPGGAALYVRTNGGAGTTLYVYEPGSGWAAK